MKKKALPPSEGNTKNRELVRIRRAGQITLPLSVRKHFNLREGDYLECEIVKNGILLRPVSVHYKKPKKQ